MKQAHTKANTQANTQVAAQAGSGFSYSRGYFETLVDQALAPAVVLRRMTRE